MDDELHISNLIVKHLNHTISPEEAAELAVWINAYPEDYEQVKAYLDTGEIKPDLYAAVEMEEDAIDRAVASRLRAMKMKPEALSRTRTFSREWWTAAAAILVISVTGLFFYLRSWSLSHEQISSRRTTIADINKMAIRPCVVFSDGDSLYLDDLPAGNEIERDGLRLMLTATRHIVYRAADGLVQRRAYAHILSIPYGQKWELTLLDGSDIQLNAGSAVKYCFNDPEEERQVTLRGGALFEVAPDANHPFIASAGNVQVKAKGTRFSMECYNEQKGVKTLLLSGKVDVIAGSVKKALKPGQEAFVPPGSSAAIQLTENADTARELAWTKDSFNFKDLTIPEAMQQVSKWYGLDREVYEAYVDLKDRGLLGDEDINKALSLGEVLKKIGNGKLKLRFIVEGRTLRVSK